jgi:hypothetical protein
MEEQEITSIEDALTFVKEDGYLSLVPESFITTEICLAAVQFNGTQLKFVPEELRTYEICLAAIKKNYRAF